uniref:Uncharacterized protein n=1 Tax=Timema tahoe TaxID=61484 RepID=A0A7R9IDM0_9NEOP|nr:unnamed protein product [Timema tahoe]
MKLALCLNLLHGAMNTRSWYWKVWYPDYSSPTGSKTRVAVMGLPPIPSLPPLTRNTPLTPSTVSDQFLPVKMFLVYRLAHIHLSHFTEGLMK